MADTNPGQQKLAYDQSTNQPRLSADVSYDDKTSLDDIKQKYTDVGNQYNQFVQDARQNVADQQTEHIGNNFGASPYNTNTYYEPGATDFVSTMRQQGAQQAFTAGMDRGRKEAEANLNAKKNAYSNAITAYNNAYDNYQNSKNAPVIASIDKSLLPEGVNEDEWANWLMSSSNSAEAMQRAIDSTNFNNASVKDWNNKATIDAVKNELGENSDAWKEYAKHMKTRGNQGVSERFADTELGRVWADTYAKNYIKQYYGDDAMQTWQTSYNKLRRLVTNLTGLKSGDFSWSDNVVPVQDLPENMSVGTNFKYIDIIAPEFKNISDIAADIVKIHNGRYTIYGQEYSPDEVRVRVAESLGTTVEELDAKQKTILSGPSSAPVHDKSSVQDMLNNTNLNVLQKWAPTTKQIYNAFAKDKVSDAISGYETFSISADTISDAVLGVGVQEAKAIAKMRAENPEGYERLTDQITRAITDASVFELADGNKEYFVNGKYQKLDRGTVIMNVTDAALDADGAIIDEDLKRLAQLYKTQDEPTVDKEKWEKEYTDAWKNYATRLAWARAVTNQTDGTIDKDIYAAMLYNQNKNTYKNLVIDGKKISDIIAEFRRKTESNPDGAYKDFTGLWEQAYKNIDYFFTASNGRISRQGLYDAKGNSTVGRVGESQRFSDMGPNKAMALVALYAASMDSFQSGAKDGNINPKFLDKDGSNWFESTWTTLTRSVESTLAFVSGAASMGANWIGDALGGGQRAQKANGDITAYLNDLANTSGTLGSYRNVNDLVTGDFDETRYGYTSVRNDANGTNIRNAVNPLSLTLWGLSDEKAIEFGAGGAVMRGIGDFSSRAVGFIGAQGIEILATAGIGAVAKAGAIAVKSGVSAGASKLLNAVQGASIKSVADAAKTVAINDLLNPTDEILGTVGKRVVADIANPTDEIAENVAKRYAKGAASNVDDAAKATITDTSKIGGNLAKVGSIDDLTDAGKMYLGSLNKTANETTNKFMKVISRLANNVDNYDGFAIKFSEQATKFITKDYVAKSLASAGFTNIDDVTLDAAVKFYKDQFTSLGQVSARQTYQTALISGFTGKTPAVVAGANSEVLTYLSKMIGDWYDNPSLVSNFSGIWGQAAKGKMTMADIKKTFGNILEESAKATASGIYYGKSDIIRTLARNGWNSKRIQLVMTNSVFRNHGLAEDVLQDVIRGYTMPSLNADGETERVSIEDYFKNGDFVFPLAMNGIQLVGGAIKGRIKSAVYSKQLDKAYRALAATEMDSADYVRRFAEVQKISAKAEKNANKMLDENLSFSKMNDVAKRGHGYIDEANEKLFKILEKDMKSVDKNFSRKTKAQQAEFIRQRFKAPEAVAQAYVNAQTDAFITYPHLKRLLGGDKIGTLSTLEDSTMLSKIWKTMADTADKHRMALKNNKRFKTIWDKQADMRRLQKQAVMDTLRGANGSHAISELESSLDSWFNIIDDVAKKNVANGVMTEDSVRLGYLPMTGIMIGEPNDGVPAPARALWMGGKAGASMQVASADPVLKREVNITDLIDAYSKGEEAFTYIDANGNSHTVNVNPQGFQFLDSAVAYRNANTFHRTVGAILGGDAESTGSAAVKSGYVQFHGIKASKAAATADVTNLKAQINNMENIAKAKMTADLKSKDAKAAARAKKALSDLSRQENSILKIIGRNTTDAEGLRKQAGRLRKVATGGYRPEDAPKLTEILGVDNDSANKIGNRAHAKIQEDIKLVQSGEDLKAGVDYTYKHMIKEAARNNGNYDYDLVVRRAVLDNVPDRDIELDLTSTSKNPLRTRMSPHNIKFKDNTTVHTAYGSLEIPKGTTVEDAFQGIAKKSKKGHAPSIDSIIPAGDMKATQEVYNDIFRAAVGDEGIKYVADHTPPWTSFVEKYDTGTTSSAKFWTEAIGKYRQGDDFVMPYIAPARLSSIPAFPVNENGLKITPNKKIDAKAEGKGIISNKFIGFAEPGSSTNEYMKQAGRAANVGKYSSDDVVFVSVQGAKETNPTTAAALRTKTIQEATNAINHGATLITDTENYIFGRNKYNVGEKQLYNTLREGGYHYEEIKLPTGQRAGKWTKAGSLAEDKFMDNPGLLVGGKFLSREQLSQLDMDNNKTRGDVNTALTNLVMKNSGVTTSKAELRKPYERVLGDAFSQAKTIMGDQIKLDDIEGGEGGFARGFYTYLDTVDRLLPDKELYATAVDTGLTTKLNSLGKDGVKLSDLNDIILDEIAIRKAAGDDIDDLITAYKVLSAADDAGQRAAGTGDYVPGRIRGGGLDDEDLSDQISVLNQGITDITGRVVDSTDFDNDFTAEKAFSTGQNSAGQLNINEISAENKILLDKVEKDIFDDREEYKKALETTANILNKMTNRSSDSFSTRLSEIRNETAAVFKSANDIRDKINTAVNALAKTDPETKQLIDAEVARRQTRQKGSKKVQTAASKYDAAAALGIARPGKAILYSDNPSQYNAVALSLREGRAGLANEVRAIRGTGIEDAESILGYLREGRDGVESLDALINFDAGQTAGIYHQLNAAVNYLEEKGVGVSGMRKELDSMKRSIGDTTRYGDIYGNFNPPELSMSAALAEVPDKTSFFNSFSRGVDRFYTGKYYQDGDYFRGSNTWKAYASSVEDMSVEYSGGKLSARVDYGTSNMDAESGVSVVVLNDAGDEVDFGSLTEAERRAFADEFNEISNDLKIVKRERAKKRVLQQIPVTDETGKVVLNADGSAKTRSRLEVHNEMMKLKENRVTVVEELKTARSFGDLSENAEYSAALDKLKSIDKQIDKLRTALGLGQSEEKDFAQKLAADWVVENTEKEEWDSVKDFFFGDYRLTPQKRVWEMYLVETVDKKKPEDYLAEANKLEKKASRLDKKSNKLSNQKNAIAGEKEKTPSVKSLAEDSRGVNYKKYMSPEDYTKYQELKQSLKHAEDYTDGKSEIYHALNGATFNGDAAGYSNMVRLSDFLKTYGYVPGKQGEYDIKVGDGAGKTMKKELRKGNLRSKSNWGEVVDNAVELPSTMDKGSAELTIANLLNFNKQVIKASGLDYVDMDQIWVDKSYLELLARYADSPNSPTGLMSFASKVSALPNWIQQQQLAGGWGPINALTLANVRSAILESPTKAVAFAKMMADMRNSRSAANSIMDRSDLLAKIAMETGDGSIVTDLYPVISKRSGRDDGGVLQTFATKILDRTDRKNQVYDRFPKGFRDQVAADVEDFFENPTFQQALPVMRAQMISMNYDSALSHLNKRFKGRIGKDISIDDIDKAAMSVAYAKTQKFFTPQKYWNADYETGLQRIKNENVRKLVGQITGEGTPTTVLDIASSAFFALRYKQTFVNRFVQGVKASASVPRMIRNRLSASTSIEDVVQDLSSTGQIKGVASLIGISVLAKVWCDAMGVPNAWDDFDFAPEGDEAFHMPSVLMKFQTAGQIWLPNDTKKNGTPFVNPDKTAYKIDPFFSMFTLPNTAMRSINMAFNANTDSYKAPQRGLPFIGVNSPINQALNSSVGRAIGDELIGSNLLSPFKAVHEILSNSTYFGNNIWERKYLPDGRENPNYNPGRNIASSTMHLLGLDTVLDPNGYNRWVKGGDNMARQDQVGTIAGSGILQHEYLSAAISLLEGDLAGAAIEAGELPIKTERLSSKARTEMNTVVKNTLDHYGDEYRERIKHASGVDEKDKIYADYMRKCANEVARWSAKHGYILGNNQELVASMTRLVTAMTSGEYDDSMAYVQNAYWKASKIAQIESGTNLFLKDGDLDDWIANGGTIESFTEEKLKRSNAYNEALDDEYEARKALINAGYNPEYLAGSKYEDIRAETRAINKKIYTSIMASFEKPVGEFKNYKQLKSYYEELINNASSKSQKAKLANKYNDYVKDIIAKAIGDYGPMVLRESTVNSSGLAQQLADYIIIPADKYYSGKSPRTNYLRDMFGVGYQNRKNLPSDDEFNEKFNTAKWLVSHGQPASAQSILNQTLTNVKNGRLYVSDVDYSKMLRLKSMLRSKQ